MIYAKVRLKLHWGFSIAEPGKSKAEPALLLPPKTTLVGALSFGAYRGVDTVLANGRPALPPSALVDRIYYAAARFGDDTLATYIEDVERHVVTYFQRPERAGAREYWFDVIPRGKVYAPGGELVVVYLTEELGREELRRLAWSIIRVGSRESLVSVEDVEIGEARKVVNQVVATKYYFPADVELADRAEAAKLVYVDFWEGGLGLGEEGRPVRFALPIQRFPLRSVEVRVRAREAWEVGGEYVVTA